MATEVRSSWNTGARQRQSDNMSPGCRSNPSGERYFRGDQLGGMPTAQPPMAEELQQISQSTGNSTILPTSDSRR